MHEYIVDLVISQTELERLYSGEARVVVSRDIEGRSIQFPASALRPFVNRDGVRGRFIIRVDETHRLQSIHRSNG